VSFNGQNGAGGDIRGGHYAVSFVTVDNCIGNPVQGPFLNFAKLADLPMHATQVLVRGGSIAWNGPSGGRIINYGGYGGVKLDGVQIAGDGEIRVYPESPVSASGPVLLTDMVQWFGEPVPKVVILPGRHHDRLSIYRNVGRFTDARLQ
jgi:hypothetical protein